MTDFQIWLSAFIVIWAVIGLIFVISRLKTPYDVEKEAELVADAYLHRLEMEEFEER